MTSGLSPEIIEILTNTPAVAPPAGITPNFINPPTKAPVLIALNAVFLPLMLVAFTIRMWVKGMVVRKLGWDDYTCAFAAICSIIHTACIFSSLNYGFGKHLYDVRAITLIDSKHIQQLTASIIPYPFTILAVKLSILLLYRRVFSIDRFLHYATLFGFVLLAVVQLPYIVTQIYTVVKCDTPETLLSSPWCSHLYTINITQSAVNLVTDFFVLLIPLPKLVKLNLPIRKKIGLCVIFAAGFATSVVSIVRLIIMDKTLNLNDYTWGTATTIELSVVEVNVAIICACVTTFPPFFARSKLFLNSFRSKYGWPDSSISWSRSRSRSRSRKASKQSTEGWSTIDDPTKTDATVEIPLQVPAQTYSDFKEERRRERQRDIEMGVMPQDDGNWNGRTVWSEKDPGIDDSKVRRPGHAEHLHHGF